MVGVRRLFAPVWGRVVALRSRSAVLGLMALALFFTSCSLLVGHPRVTRFDYGVTQWLQSFQGPVVTELAAGFTFLASTGTLLVLGAAIAAALYLSRHRQAALLAALTLLAIPLNYAIKVGFNRGRPDAGLVEVLRPSFGPSYPSGHAMSATAFYGFLAALVWIHATTAQQRYYGAMGFVATAAMVCLSRIYLGVHFFSDVLGGIAAGLFLLTCTTLVYRRWMAAATRPATVAHPERR